MRHIFILLLFPIKLFIFINCSTKMITDSNTKKRFFEYSPSISINFEIHGNGQQPMLLLHGFGASLESWRDIQPLLTDSFQLYLYDLKGSGFSSKPDDGVYSIEHQAEIVISFIKHYDLNNLVLVGHSYGGAVALIAFFKLIDNNDEDRINSLILIDSAGYPQKLPFFISILRIPFVNRLVLKLFPAHYQVKFTLRRIFYNPIKVTTERVDRHARFYKLPGSHNALIETANQIVPDNPDSITARISEIKIPTLIIWGKDDPVIPLEHARRFNREISESRLEIIPECGHVSHEEKPDETVRFIKQFLKQ